MTQMQDVYTDLAAEAADLDRLVSGLDADTWARLTPSPGWTIADQLAHLAFIARLAGLAASDADAFEALAAPSRVDFQGSVDAALAEYRGESPEGVLARWRAEWDSAIKALTAAQSEPSVPWLVNPLPPSILAAAGIMELFAHGQDIADAAGIRREYTDRVGHLAFFAVMTRDFGYQAHGLTPPTDQWRYELTAPSGEKWEWGPDDAAQRVVGPAVDFCLLSTRRRHHADLSLVVAGSEAERWLEIAQCYRGPAGAGREPGQFAEVG